MVQILKASIAVATAVDNYIHLLSQSKKQIPCSLLTHAITKFKCSYKSNSDSNSYKRVARQTYKLVTALDNFTNEMSYLRLQQITNYIAV